MRMEMSEPAGCPACETLPDEPPTGGALHLALALPRITGKLRALLRRSGASFDEPEAGVVSVTLADGGLAKLALDLAGLLTPGEQRDCPCLLLPAGQPPSLGDVLRAQPLSRLVGRIRGEWVRQMLVQQRLTTHFQPI